jgi:hypothetical protein
MEKMMVLYETMDARRIPADELGLLYELAMIPLSDEQHDKFSSPFFIFDDEDEDEDDLDEEDDFDDLDDGFDDDFEDEDFDDEDDDYDDEDDDFDYEEDVDYDDFDE